MGQDGADALDALEGDDLLQAHGYKPDYSFDPAICHGFSLSEDPGTPPD